MDSKKRQDRNSFPKVTFIIPTYNAQKYLEMCLKGIFKQDYPKDKYEVFVVDGGSSDNTIRIAKKFKVKIFQNPQKDPETAKSIGIQHSTGEIVALMDSDNEIIKKDWLKVMVRPLIIDPNLFGVESYYFPKKGESIFNTYSMLAHIADPFSRCLAGRLQQVKKDRYLECTIKEHSVYPLGANGFFWNKKIIEEINLYKPKFEESNFSFFVVSRGYRRFARVPGYGIYHYHIDSLGDFISKRIKIGNKFLVRTKEKRKTWLGGVSPLRFIFCLFYCVTVLGPLIEGIYNYIKSGQKAWLLHPLMSFISVSSYGIVLVKRKFQT